MAKAFGAPFTLVIRGGSAPTGFDPIAHGAGVPFISTELAGGAGLDRVAVEIGWSGVRRVLREQGVVDWPEPGPVDETCFLDAMDGGAMVMAPITGIFEPCAGLGQSISKGDPAGRLWSLEEIERPPIELFFDTAGIVVA